MFKELIEALIYCVIILGFSYTLAYAVIFS